MKKRLLTSFMSMVMIFMMSSTMAFAQETMTSAEILAKSNESGKITLTEDVVLSDALNVNGKNYTIDLAGNTLKFTQATNLFTNNANVTFVNGTINLDGIQGSADCILGIGHYASSATLTFDKVNVEAKNYKSPYALIYVYNSSTLNIKNGSKLNAENEKSNQGGVIKTQGINGKVNVVNSELNFKNTKRGILDGTINIENSKVEMNALVNGINSSNGGLNLTVNSSDVSIKGSIGRALTVNNSKVNVVNGSELKLTGSLLNDIAFEGEGTVKLDETSELEFKKVDPKVELKDVIILPEGQEMEKDENGNFVKVCEHKFENGSCTICGEKDPNFIPEEDTTPGTPEVPGTPEDGEDTDKPEEDTTPGTPEVPGTPEDGENTETPDAPSTGDNNHLLFMAGIFAVAAIVLPCVRRQASK